MNNGLIVCPVCREQKKYNALGSVSTTGEFYILRYKGDVYTIITALEYSVGCPCGFGTTITPFSSQHLIQ